jgi:hypothetical protein
MVVTLLATALAAVVPASCGHLNRISGVKQPRAWVTPATFSSAVGARSRRLRCYDKSTGNNGTGTRLVTSAQIRAARGLLDWTVRDLSERAGVPRNTVSNMLSPGILAIRHLKSR